MSLRAIHNQCMAFGCRSNSPCAEWCEEFPTSPKVEATYKEPCLKVMQDSGWLGRN